jgi:hypothetical protein
MIPNPYYLGNLPLTFSNTLGPTTYPFSNMVSIGIATIGENQGIQAFVMTTPVAIPISRYSTINLMPYFQLPM